MLTGSIDVTLTTTFSTTDGNVIVDLLDVGPDGSVTDLGPAGYLKASHRLSHSQRHPLEADKPYRLTLTIPSKFWAFQEGHRLRLTVSSADEIVAKDAPTGTVTISTGGKSSYVDLHTIKAMHH